MCIRDSAARGVNHYQRAGKPPGWDKTGRLWGHTGTWPIGEPVAGSNSREEFWRFRRLVRSWRVADARAELLLAVDEKGRRAARRRVASGRRMLRCNDRVLSQVRGVSEWIPEGLGMALLLMAAGDAGGAREAASAAPRAPRAPRRQEPTIEYF